MSVKEIITLENDEEGILSRPTIPLKDMPYTDSIKQLFQDLKDTAASIGCLGLAANQIGSPFSVFLVVEDSGPLIVVNPTVVAKSGRMYSYGEGCLSAGERRDVRRFKTFIVEGRDEHGDHIRIKRTGKSSAPFQHEVDHLNGKTILNRGGR